MKMLIAVAYLSLVRAVFVIASELPSPLPTESNQLISTESEVIIKNIIYQGQRQFEPWRHLVANEIRKTQPSFLGPFPCDTRGFRSVTPPSSVHRLKPGDIDVVAALGDSLIAGMGGSGFTQIGSLIEDRGYSWGIGGVGTWRDALTLPNILREFNPNLLGYSSGTGTSSSRQSWFNVAEPGALARQLPYMARVLVLRIKKDKRVDFYNHWKLVTLIIGNNDICSNMCYLDDPASVIATMRIAVRKTLDYLRDNLPNTIVSVVPVSKLHELPSIYEFPKICYLPHHIFCPCLFGPRFQKNKKYFSQINEDLQRATVDAVVDGDYNRLDNFTVVLQPFSVNARLPMQSMTSEGKIVPDIMSLAPDCFHFSQFGCAKAANSLWNNMLEPVGHKSHSWQQELLEIFKCPTTGQPYIYTAKNSHLLQNKDIFK